MTTTNNTSNKLQSIYNEALKVNKEKATAIYQAGACGAITSEEVIEQLKQLQPEQEQKTRSLKCLANDAAKAEMFSLKQATAAVKNAYDQDKERKDTRAYVESLGFSANVFKSLQWQDLQEYATTKSGRFSTWAVLNALAKYATAKDIKGEQAAKEQRKADRAAAKQAAERMKAAKAAERKAEQEKKAEQKRQAEAQAAAKKCADKAQRRAAKKAA